MSDTSPFFIETNQRPESFIKEVQGLFEGVVKEDGDVMKIRLTVAYYPPSHHFDKKDEIKNLKRRTRKGSKAKKNSVPGVYVFLLVDDSCTRCLKVGKVRDIHRDYSRWHSQHYNGQAISTLPGSIVEYNKRFELHLTNEEKEKEQTKELLKNINNYKEIEEKELLRLLEIYNEIKAKTGKDLLEGITQNARRNIHILLDYLKPKKDGNAKEEDKIKQEKEKIKKEEEEIKKIDKVVKDIKKQVGQWIKDNTCRLEFIFDEEEMSNPTYAENFLEGYLHWLLKPCYEGKVDDDNESTSDSSDEEGENQ